MTTAREKTLIRAAINYFTDDNDSWEEGMDILAHLTGERTARSKQIVREALGKARASAGHQAQDSKGNNEE